WTTKIRCPRTGPVQARTMTVSDRTQTTTDRAARITIVVSNDPTIEKKRRLACPAGPRDDRRSECPARGRWSASGPFDPQAFIRLSHLCVHSINGRGATFPTGALARARVADPVTPARRRPQWYPRFRNSPRLMGARGIGASRRATATESGGDKMKNVKEHTFLSRCRRVLSVESSVGSDRSHGTGC